MCYKSGQITCSLHGLGTDLFKLRQVGFNTIVVAFVTFIAAAVGSLLLIMAFGLGDQLALK